MAFKSLKHFLKADPFQSFGFSDGSTCTSIHLGADKSCFCEKPLAVDVAAARAAVADWTSPSSNKNRLSAAVNFPFAYMPSAVRFVEEVRGGAVGSVASVNGTIRMHFPRWPRAWQASAASW